MLTLQMKSQAVIVAIKAVHSVLPITCFLKVARAFVIKVRKELKVADWDSLVVAKCRTPAEGPNTIKIVEYLRRVYKIIEQKSRN